MYLVCWNHNCRKTYPADQFKPDDRNIKCKECGGTVISNSGKVTLTQNEYHPKTINPKHYDRMNTL